MRKNCVCAVCAAQEAFPVPANVCVCVCDILMVLGVLHFGNDKSISVHWKS